MLRANILWIIKKEKSIELTPKGLELINKANEYISNVEKDLSNLIGQKELTKYKETQSKIYEYLEDSK